jgi:pyruvate dehydrogenase E1 component beta subunit
MFSDFLPTAGDAIVNELPKYRFMSGGQCTVPVTIRSISGATGRFGTQHSATGESWYMGQPGLRGTSWASPPRSIGLPNDLLVSYSPPLEDEILPSPELIAQVARSAVRG